MADREGPSNETARKTGWAFIEAIRQFDRSS